MGRVKTAMKAYLALKMLSSFKKKRRRQYIREIFQDKDKGFFNSSFEVLYSRDEEMFFKIIKMRTEMFDALLNLLEPYLMKFSIRTPIKPKERLFLTLIYLAQGSAFHIMSSLFTLGHTTVRNIILESSEQIWNVLGPLYVTVPHQDEWKRIAKDFEDKWNLPNCVGAIDGKHINLVAPPNSGSLYYNFKGHHSIVLLAICDANYIFTGIDVGAYGSQSDGGIFARSKLGQGIIKNELKLPADAELPNSQLIMPHFFVGDAAFPLLNNLMKPFPGRNLGNEKNHTNYRISRARITIENSFGILSSRRRVLRTNLHLFPKNAEKVVLACVTLHNFLKMHNCSAYCRENLDETEEDCVPLTSIATTRLCNRPSTSASNNREILSRYLNNSHQPEPSAT